MAMDWRSAARRLAMRTRNARQRTFAIVAELLSPRMTEFAAVTVTLGALAGSLNSNAVLAQDGGRPIWNQPGSTLLLLVATLLGIDGLHSAYQAALANDYRFLSFGDAMLILPDAS